MNYYESMVVLKPELSEKDINEEVKKLEDLITQLKGNIIKTDYMGKRSLAYMIKKYREGHYVVNYMKLPPTEVGKVEIYYRLSENILRYNLLRKEAPKSEE